MWRKIFANCENSGFTYPSLTATNNADRKGKNTMRIDKGIPLPDPGRGPGRPSAYDWSKLKDVNHSYFADGYTKPSDCPAYKSALAWGKRNGVKFEGRRWGTGIRIWRVS